MTSTWMLITDSENVNFVEFFSVKLLRPLANETAIAFHQMTTALKSEPNFSRCFCQLPSLESAVKS